MTRDEFFTRWSLSVGSENLPTFARDLDKILADARAAILADEERRVWMAVYVREIYDARNESTAIAFADRRLTVWREARAAWEARDG